MVTMLARRKSEIPYTNPEGIVTSYVGREFETPFSAIKVRIDAPETSKLEILGRNEELYVRLMTRQELEQEQQRA